VRKGMARRAVGPPKNGKRKIKKENGTAGRKKIDAFRKPADHLQKGQFNQRKTKMGRRAFKQSARKELEGIGRIYVRLSISIR